MIHKAIKRAYKTFHDRGWDKMYWAIDLHGTCLHSNYANKNFEFVNRECIDALRFISELPETVIIIWSSCYDSDFEEVKKLFESHDIKIDYLNKNPIVPNTSTGNFSDKFYFSVLLDDKAGFDPMTDWSLVKLYVNQERAAYGMLTANNPIQIN
jgi:hypothetical protein